MPNPSQNSQDDLRLPILLCGLCFLLSLLFLKEALTPRTGFEALSAPIESRLVGFDLATTKTPDGNRERVTLQLEGYTTPFYYQDKKLGEMRELFLTLRKGQKIKLLILQSSQNTKSPKPIWDLQIEEKPLLKFQDLRRKETWDKVAALFLCLIMIGLGFQLGQPIPAIKNITVSLLKNFQKKPSHA